MSGILNIWSKIDQERSWLVEEHFVCELNWCREIESRRDISVTSKLNMNSKQSPAAAASNSTAKFGRLGPNQLSMFQHPDAPNLKIRFKSANFYCQLPININNQSTVNNKYLADLIFQ